MGTQVTEREHATQAASRPDFRVDIQGLRGVAVLAVVLYHAGLPGLTGGYVGVDIFFVISGFLITSHLLRGIGPGRRLSLAGFYARRMRRILPASFVVLFATVAGALIWAPPLLFKEIFHGAVATAVYAPNVLFFAKGRNYLSETTPSLFQHYWSLGIEEQFYLVWPLILIIIWRLTRSTRTLAWVVGVLVAASFAGSAVLTDVSQPMAFYLLPTRAWELGIGGLLALVLAHGAIRARGPARLGGAATAAVGWLGLAGIVAACVTFTSSTTFPGVAAALPTLSTAAVIWAGAHDAPWGPARLLSTRGIVFVGTISYSLYLVHWPALTFPQVAVGFHHPLPLAVTLLIAVACVPLAWALYRWVEVPGRRWRWLVEARPRRTFAVAALASASAIAFATVSYEAVKREPVSTVEVAQSTVVSEPPAATDFVPANLSPALDIAYADMAVSHYDGCLRGRESTDASACLYGDADAPRIALLGDSHASQWLPAVQAVADGRGHAVAAYLKESCPTLVTPVRHEGAVYAQCEQWLADAVADINAQQPALVVLASYSGIEVVPVDGSDERAWEEGLAAIIGTLDVPVAVMADTPDLVQSPPLCLSARLSDALYCGVDPARALHPDIAEVVAATTAAHGATLVDLNSYLCDEDMCPTIIGDTLVYKDDHHLTATFAGLMGAAMDAGLAPLFEAGAS